MSPVAWPARRGPLVISRLVWRETWQWRRASRENGRDEGGCGSRSSRQAFVLCRGTQDQARQGMELSHGHGDGMPPPQPSALAMMSTAAMVQLAYDSAVRAGCVPEGPRPMRRMVFRSWRHSRADKDQHGGHDHPKLRQRSFGNAALAGRANARVRKVRWCSVGCSGNLAGGAWGAESHMHAARPGHHQMSKRVRSSAIRHGAERRSHRLDLGEGPGACITASGGRGGRKPWGNRAKFSQRTTELQGNHQTYMHPGRAKPGTGCAPAAPTSLSSASWLRLDCFAWCVWMR